MTDLTLDGLVLPPDLLWSDEFDWTPTEQHQSRTLTGALVFETAGRLAGRPITLQGGQDFGWATRAQLNALHDKLAIGTFLVLVLPDSRTFNVRFRHEDKPLEAKMIIDYRVPVDADFYQLSIKLITV